MKMFGLKQGLLAASGALALSAFTAAPAGAIELKEAVQIAVDSNPQVNQAIQDKQAIDFERRQAQGLYLPRVDVEAAGGVERLDNPTRRALGLETQTLSPVEGSLTLQETLFDSGSRHSELLRQAARSDGAATRVGERAEFIALETAREYLNYLLQQRLVAAAQDNVAYHEKMVGDLSEGVRSGSISVADQQQAQERLSAARARVVEAREGLVNAMIAFTTRTGVPLDQVSLPPELPIPANLNDAIGIARENNPTIKIAMADVDAADAFVRKTESDLWPKLALEARARGGHDVDGFRGRTSDLQARLVLRWNLYSGGITQANVQEQVRRASEQRYVLHQTTRQAEEDVRTAWNREEQQAALVQQLGQQAQSVDQLVGSYAEQFKVGRRSLLDLLDTQNTRYNTQVLLETARFAEIFARYKLLAATGQLLDTMGIQRPRDATADSRARFKVPPTPPAELNRRRHAN